MAEKRYEQYAARCRQQIPQQEDRHSDLHGHPARGAAARCVGPEKWRREDHQERRRRGHEPLRQCHPLPAGGHHRAGRGGDHGHRPHRLRRAAHRQRHHDPPHEAAGHFPGVH